MREFSVVNTEVLLRARAECLLAPVGLLTGRETVADAMNDPLIRPWFGHMLQRELMPQLPEEGRDEAVIAACRYLSFKPASLRCEDLVDGLTDAYRLHILPLLGPDRPGLTMALAALIMLFCGVRRAEDGFRLPKELMDRPLQMDERALTGFSRLSWDMQADSLAYAALADVDIWGRDLRTEPGLTDGLTDALWSIQLNGLMGAIGGCYQ